MGPNPGDAAVLAMLASDPRFKSADWPSPLDPGRPLPSDFDNMLAGVAANTPLEDVIARLGYSAPPPIPAPPGTVIDPSKLGIGIINYQIVPEEGLAAKIAAEQAPPPPLPAGGGGASASASGAPGAGGIIAGLEALRIKAEDAASDIALKTAESVKREQEAQDAGAQLIKTSEENKWLAIEEGLKTDLFHQTLQADAEQKHADFMDRANAHIENRIASFANVSRDPWAEAGTAGRITDSLAIILGGMGQGMLRYGAKDSGAVNLGLKMIEKRIEQDLDARKFEITADIRQADAASAEFNSASGRRQVARAAAFQRVAIQVESEGARYKSASALNNAAQLKEALMQKSLDARGKALQDSATQSRMIYATELQARELGLRGWMATHGPAEKVNPRLLVGPQISMKYAALDAGVKNITALSNDFSRLGWSAGFKKWFPTTDARNYDLARGVVGTFLANALSGQAMPEEQRLALTDLLAKPGAWAESGAAMFGALVKTMKSNRDSLISTEHMAGRDTSGFPASATAPALDLVQK